MVQYQQLFLFLFAYLFFVCFFLPFQSFYFRVVVRSLLLFRISLCVGACDAKKRNALFCAILSELRVVFGKAKTCLAHLTHGEDANIVREEQQKEHVHDGPLICFQYFFKRDFPCFNQRRAAPDVQAAINII